LSITINDTIIKVFSNPSKYAIVNRWTSEKCRLDVLVR